MSVNYAYSDGDLLHSPQTYRYTTFQGEAFVQAWQVSRLTARAQLPAPALLTLHNLTDVSAADSTALLSQICLKLRSGTVADDELAQYWLPRLLKKFEVSKRLYAGYEADAPHRALPDSDFMALTPYLLLAEGMIHGWRAEGAGYYLSALLKLNDTLVSQQTRLDPAQAAYLAWILDSEQQLIAELTP